MAMKVERISAVTFRVSNMKASVQFYRDVLGMEVLYGGGTAGFSSLRAKDADSAILNLEQGERVNGWGSAYLPCGGCGRALETLQQAGIRARKAAECFVGRTSQLDFNLRDSGRAPSEMFSCLAPTNKFGAPQSEMQDRAGRLGERSGSKPLNEIP